MAKINLLPWRAERRKARQREFQGMLAGAAIGAVLIVFGIVTYYGQRIDDQNGRNAYLQQQITEVSAQIAEIDALDAKKRSLLARKEVIERLQANRSQMVHLFDQLVRTIPEGVRLTSIKQEGQVLTLDGQAQSSARVSAYMRNLDASGWLRRSDLQIIEQRGNDRGLPFAFSLKVNLVNPNAPADPNAPAGSAQGGA